MTTDILIKVGEVKLKGELTDTSCAKSIAERLPIETEFQVWGDEFYFPVGVDMFLDDTSKAKVSVGTIGYWPPGQAMAIFFGPTPASDDDEPVAASEVNIIGKVEDAQRLKKVKDAGKIRVEPQ
ncbi:MAG: cyclophilin-like fold protein [Thermoplasmatota archaeon]